jgi:hypothetical protein
MEELEVVNITQSDVDQTNLVSGKIRGLVSQTSPLVQAGFRCCSGSVVDDELLHRALGDLAV